MFQGKYKKLPFDLVLHGHKLHLLIGTCAMFFWGETLDNNSRGCIRRRVRPPAPRPRRDAARKGCGDEGRVSTPYKFRIHKCLHLFFKLRFRRCVHFLRDSSTNTHTAGLPSSLDDGLENINTKMFPYCSKFIATSSLSLAASCNNKVGARRDQRRNYTRSLSLPPSYTSAPLPCALALSCTTQQLDAESPILSFNMNNGPPTW